MNQSANAHPSGADGPETWQQLLSEIYEELKRRARQLMRGSSCSTMQPTALAHEAWLRIVSRRPTSIHTRDDFLAYAATAMRNILVDHARKRSRFAAAGEAEELIELAIDGSQSANSAFDVLAVDEALRELEQFDPEMARAVELRFFGGLEFASIAALIGRPKRTFERNWRATCAWLSRRLT